QIGYGMFALAKQRSLVRRWEKAAAEQVEPARWDQAALEHDEAGQIVAFAAQAVSNPTAHTRPALKSRAGVHEVVGRGVLGVIRDHRADDRHVVDAGSHVRKQVTDVRAGLAVFAKAEWRTQDFVADVEHSGRRLERKRLAAFLLQTGLGIERVHLRR